MVVIHSEGKEAWKLEDRRVPRQSGRGRKDTSGFYVSRTVRYNLIFLILAPIQFLEKVIKFRKIYYKDFTKSKIRNAISSQERETGTRSQEL